MTRFLPAQLQSWTGGILVQPPFRQNSSDCFYRGISTDTRKLRKDEIFLALKGERFDGHDYAETAIGKGAGMLVLDEASEQAMELYHRLSHGEEELPDLLLVPDTLKAYQEIARGYRQTLLAPLIAITGSVGKTTTRRMVNTVIASQMVTHETVENQNNLIGVPLTILEADDDDDVIVCELGMDRRGEIATLSDICHPDISIITSIGYSHAEYLGSRENILKEKMDIILGMRSNGLVLINGQDALLNQWAAEHQHEISVWRICNEPCSCDPEIEKVPCFWAEGIKVTPEQTQFMVRTTLDPSIRAEVTIKSPGKFLVRAALFAMASAYALGLNMETAAKACAEFENTGNRQHIVNVGSWMVIDDSYNASPESVLAALDTLELLGGDGRRKIACLGGIRELGSYCEQLHREIGQKLAAMDIDLLLLAGEESRYIIEGLHSAGCSVPVRRFENAEQIAEDLLANIEENDIVLLKGSRYYKMEKVREVLEKKYAERGGDSSCR